MTNSVYSNTNEVLAVLDYCATILPEEDGEITDQDLADIETLEEMGY